MVFSLFLLFVRNAFPLCRMLYVSAGMPVPRRRERCLCHAGNSNLQYSESMVCNFFGEKKEKYLWKMNIFAVCKKPLYICVEL